MLRRLRPLLSLICMLGSLVACGTSGVSAPAPSSTSERQAPVDPPSPTATPAPTTTPTPSGNSAPAPTVPTTPATPATPAAGETCVGSGDPRICLEAGALGRCTAESAPTGGVAARCTLQNNDQLCIYHGGSSNCTTASGNLDCDISVVGNSVNRNCN